MPQQECRRLPINCNCGTSTVTALSGPPPAPVVAKQRAREHRTQQQRCGVTTFFCAVWHCAYLSLCHNCNVQHSVDELKVRRNHCRSSRTAGTCPAWPQGRHRPVPNSHGGCQKIGPSRVPSSSTSHQQCTFVEPGPTGAPTRHPRTPRTRPRRRPLWTAAEPPAKSSRERRLRHEPLADFWRCALSLSSTQVVTGSFSCGAIC